MLRCPAADYGDAQPGRPRPGPPRLPDQIFRTIWNNLEHLIATSLRGCWAQHLTISAETAAECAPAFPPCACSLHSRKITARRTTKRESPMPYFGVCYSPYHRTNSHPPYDVSEADVDADMAIIKARGFTHIRTHSVTSGDPHNVDRAGKYGLKVALRVWIQNNVQNNALVDEAVSQAAAAASAYRGINTVVDLVIGNEVNRKDGKDELLDPDVILNYMRYAREQLKKHPDLTNIRVTTCFSGVARRAVVAERSRLL